MSVKQALTDNVLPIDGIYTDAPYVSQFSLESEQPYMESRTWSQKLTRVVRAGHMWKLKLNFNPMQADSFNLLNGFLKAKQAEGSSFQANVGLVTTPGSAALSVPSASDSATLRQTTLTFSDSLDPSKLSEWTTQGYVNFVGSNKLHEIVYIDSGTLKIFPGLQDISGAVTLNEPGANIGERPYMQAVFTGNLTYSLNAELLYNVSLTLEEAF